MSEHNTARVTRCRHADRHHPSPERDRRRPRRDPGVLGDGRGRGLRARRRVRPRGRQGRLRLAAVSRAVRAVRVHCRVYAHDRARHRHHHPAAAADRARRQAGCGGRHALRWPAAARARRGLEPARVRGAGRGLPHARQAHGCADPADAAPLERAARDRRARARALQRCRPQPAGDPQHPDLARAARGRRPCAEQSRTAPA